MCFAFRFESFIEFQNKLAEAVLSHRSVASKRIRVVLLKCSAALDPTGAVLLKRSVFSKRSVISKPAGRML